MSKIKSVTSYIRRELKSAGYDTSVTGKMGDCVLIEIDNSAIDVVVYKSQRGDFEAKLGHADKFSPVHLDDLVEKVNRIQKPTR